MADKDQELDKELPEPKGDKDPKSGKKTPGKVKNKIDMDPVLDSDPGSQPVSYDFAPQTNVTEALTQLQRIHRAQTMRRIEPKLKRAREIAQSRLAGDAKIKVRAQRKARDVIRSRLIGSSGMAYDDLDTASKIRIDKMVEKKTAAIQRLAVRLIPKVKKAEQDRFHSFNHKDMVKTNEEHVDEAFDKLDGADDVANTTRYRKEIIVDSDGKRKTVNKAVKVRSIDDKIQEALERKSQSSGINIDVLSEVLNNAMLDHYGSNYQHLTKEQYAFGTLNKYITEAATNAVRAKFKSNIRK